MVPLRLLIVDDEPPARARLKRLLAALRGVQVVGEAEDGIAALALVEQLAPDALLLDVQMPEVGGLDVAASLPDLPGSPAVVFVTAFDRYALRAFDAAAVDYLLKPVDPARLQRSIDRLQQRRVTPQPAMPPLPPSRLVTGERGHVQVIETAHIVWMQAADNYVELHCGARTHLMRRTLEGLLADLGPRFLRIHRSHAVAVAAVAAVQPRAKGDATVSLADGTSLNCSRPYRAALLAALQKPH
jgi:two-component system LytT family response regulator